MERTGLEGDECGDIAEQPLHGGGRHGFSVLIPWFLRISRGNDPTLSDQHAAYRRIGQTVRQRLMTFLEG